MTQAPKLELVATEKSMKHIFCILLLFMIFCTPAYAVIQDRGSPEKPTTTSVTNDDIMTSLANLDKTLSGLNTKIPSLIESRFRYYESIQRQNDVKMLLGQFGMFLVALAIYALVKRKNERNNERTLTRSEQLLTNIEERLYKAENNKEIKVVVADDTPKNKRDSQSPNQEELRYSSEIKEIAETEEDATLDEIELEPLLQTTKTKEPMPTLSKPKGLSKSSRTKRTNVPMYSMTITDIFKNHRPNDEIPFDKVLCKDCIKIVRDGDQMFENVCKPCKERLDMLMKLCEKEDKIIEKQLKLGFCDKCKKEVENGGLQRGFTPCADCIKLLKG
ncbi:hypothetical protein DRN76_03040 [Methanosarcinales archaeon]|nr:MAG: hypothetical protein DRN76_03040 [Methanosarcinales archaeon]